MRRTAAFLTVLLTLTGCGEKYRMSGEEAGALAATSRFLDLGGRPDGAPPAVYDPELKARETLHEAVEKGHLAVARLLVTKGADVNRIVDDQTPLHLAAEKGHLALAELLLDNGADTESRDDDLNTPLHMAAYESQLAVVELLLARGADIDAHNVCGGTALQRVLMPCRQPAKANEVRQVAEMLLQRGATLNVHSAAALGKTAALADLLKTHPADVNRLDTKGFTPLCYAAAHNRLAAGRLLLARGAPVWGESRIGSTSPLITACLRGHEDFARLLLDNDAWADWIAGDLEAAGMLDTSQRALRYAVYIKRPDLTALLIRRGADCFAWIGGEVLHLAVAAGDAELVRLALRQDVPINYRDGKGRTALHLAAAEGDEVIVKALLDAKANPLATTKQGKTPRQVVGGGQAGQRIEALLLRAEAIAQEPPKYAFAPSCDGERTLLALTRRFLGDRTHVNVASEYDFDLARFNRRRLHVRHEYDGDDLAEDIERGDPDERVYLRILGEAKEKNYKAVGSLLATVRPLVWGSYERFVYGAIVGKRKELLEFLLSCGGSISDVPTKYPGTGTALHFAINSQGEGGMEKVTALLEHGADASVKDCSGESLAAFACVWGETEIAEFLLTKGAEPDIVTAVSLNKTAQAKRILAADPGQANARRGGLRTPPLLLAARYGRAEMARLLLDAGADPNATSVYGWPPLWLAIRQKNKAIADLLIARGADVNRITQQRGGESRHALRVAAEESPEMIPFLVAHGANVNLTDQFGITALMALAGDADKTAGMKALLAAGADPNIKNVGAMTPLHFALSAGNAKAAELLIAAGAKVNCRDMNGRTPLHEAIGRVPNELVALLIKHGADVNARDRNGATPLHIAASLADGPVAMLLYAGAKIDAADRNGRTPLHESLESLGASRSHPRGRPTLDGTGTSSGPSDQVKTDGVTGRDGKVASPSDKVKPIVATELLTDRGADVNARDADGQTALHLVVGRFAFRSSYRREGMYGHGEDSGGSVKALMSLGAKCEIADRMGNTPLHKAVAEGSVLCTLELLKAGASVKTRNNAGDTPLVAMLRAGPGGAGHNDNDVRQAVEIIEALLKHGADPNETDRRGVPAWKLAQAIERKELAESLRPR